MGSLAVLTAHSILRKAPTMALKHLGKDPKWFQENMGRGGAIPLKPRSMDKEADNGYDNRQGAQSEGVSGGYGTGWRDQLQTEDSE